MAGGSTRIDKNLRDEKAQELRGRSETIFTGLTLVCGGKKPRYCCLRLNMSFHLATVMFSAVAFGAMVKHVPYREVLVGGILSILLTVFLVETLISLAILFTGLCSILSDYPQHPEGPERTSSNTSEPLCPPRQNQDTPGDDMRKDNE